MLRIILHKNEDRRIRGGHPWVFSNEIREISGTKMAGAAAEAYDAGGGFLGTGYYNAHSLIAFRLMSRTREDIDSVEFFTARIEQALKFREQLYPGEQTYRLVYGEADFLPGLVVDRYGDYLSLQFLTMGMDIRRDIIIEALCKLLAPRGIVARNDVAVRTLEVLDQQVEVLYGEIPTGLEVEEHGLRLKVDLMEGQKTGHFLDQRENHRILERLAPGKEVLDCFCYSGSWGLHAAKYGASNVTCVDISAKALEIAAANARLNSLEDRMAFEEADVFDHLRTLKSERMRYDVIVLDPPAFVKSRKTLKEAVKGYLTINRRGIELLNEGGYLITCSCSYHMDRELFRDTLKQAAQQAGRPIRLVETKAQAPDHPVLLSIPETEYLKCFVLQAV